MVLAALYPSTANIIRGSGMTIQQRIARCDREIAHCLACACDESMRHDERLGATMGEADWTVEKMRLERLLAEEEKA